MEKEFNKSFLLYIVVKKLTEWKFCRKFLYKWICVSHIHTSRCQVDSISLLFKSLCVVCIMFIHIRRHISTNSFAPFNRFSGGNTIYSLHQPPLYSTHDVYTINVYTAFYLAPPNAHCAYTCVHTTLYPTEQFRLFPLINKINILIHIVNIVQYRFFRGGFFRYIPYHIRGYGLFDYQKTLLSSQPLLLVF